MVAVGKAGVHVGGRRPDVVAHDEAVHRHGVGDAGLVGDVIPAAAGDVGQVLGRHDREARGQEVVVEGRHPVRHQLLALVQLDRARQRVVPVPAHDDVVAGGALVRHEAAEQLELLGTEDATCVVGAHVVVDQDELVSVGGGDAAHAEAAVEVEVLPGEALVDGIAAAHDGGLVDTREREQAGAHAAVRVAEGIGQKRAVEVRGERGLHARERLLEHGALVHVVAAVGVVVNLLEQAEVGVEPLQGGDGAVGAGKHALLAHRRSVLASHGRAVGHDAGVHEEGVVGGVGAKADVVGGHRIRPARLDLGHARRACALALDRDAVLDAAVGRLQIGDIPTHHDHHGSDHDGNGLEKNLHGTGHDTTPNRRT